MASQRPIKNDLVDNMPSDRADTLNKMLSSNHHDFSLLVHGSLHNHLAHILGSAYLLGGGVEHLRATFDTVASDLEGWPPSTLSIGSDEELHAHLGDPTYQRAFVEYFERQLADSGYDWKNLVFRYLLDGESPLLGGTVGGFGHPLIQLTDAFELASANVAVEALALTAVDYNPLAKIIDLHQATQHGKRGASNALAILHKMHYDPRFAGAFPSPGVQNTATILRSESLRKVVLEYFEALDFSDNSEEAVENDLHELTTVAVLLLSTIYRHDGPPAELQNHHFDFYLTHQMTFCWSLRVLVPVFPAAARARLFRSVWLLMVLAYLHQQLPCIQPEILHQTPLPDGPTATEWRRLRETALGSTKDRGYDPRFVKVLRTLWEFSTIWPGDEQMFLKAAVRFEHEFEGWTSYGKEGEEKMDTTM